MVQKEDRSRLPANSDVGELLAREAETASYPIKRALKRASRAAFLWPVEAAELLVQKRSLTELQGVGPFISKLIAKWLKEAPRVPPPDAPRANFLTLTAAQKILAAHADWRKKLRGDLQMHTRWSDGSGTVRDMAEAALGRGYKYIAITDHAKKLKIAGGLDEARLAAQGQEIALLNQEFRAKRFRILRSIEVNLDLSGNADMTDESLKTLDLVLGAFHSSLRRTEDQTERYLAAIRNPHIHILGHPRGRIYNYRLGLKADWPRVFSVAAELDKAVEVDCYPDRQDLSVDLLKLAKKAGVRISLGTDSHHPHQLYFIELGLAAGVLAKIPKERILNFMEPDELLTWANGLCERARREEKVFAGVPRRPPELP